MSGAGEPETRVEARVVTVSAGYGAGGSVIAPRLAQRLRLPFADRLIPAQDGPGPGPPATGDQAPESGHQQGADGGPGSGPTERVTDEERRQTARNSFFARLAHLTGGLGLPVPASDDLTDPVRLRVEQSIDDLVNRGGAVILGRAAAIVLAGHPRSFHVRLDGPPGRRAGRAMELERIDEATARSRLDETDRARARYVERLYGRDPADAVLYHLVLDSTVLTLDRCVDVLAMTALAFWESRSNQEGGRSIG